MANVSYIHPLVKNYLPLYEFINDLSNGYDGVIGGTEKYLPRTLSEEGNDKVYNARHDLATYLDSFNPVVDGINGLIFQNPIEYQTQDQDILSFLDEATQDKRNFNYFVKKFFKSSIRKGRSYAYVDIPQGNENLITNTARLKANIKPYVTFLRAEDIINFRTTTVNGMEEITMVVIVESIEKEIDQFEVEYQAQYRLVEIGKVTVYDKDFMQISQYETGLDYIPLVELNLDEDGSLFNARPPFLDIGRLSIDNYQLMSDSRWSANTASIPVLKLLGFEKEEASSFVVSVNSAILSSDANAKAEYLDYDGKGVDLNLKLIEKIEKRIAEIGMSVLSNDRQQITATEKTLDTIQTQSKLQNWVDSLEDAIKLILNYVAKYYNKEYKDEVSITANILDNGLTAEEMAKYSDMVSKGQLSNVTLWEILKSKKRLPKNFDEELESERVADANTMPTNNPFDTSGNNIQ